MRKNIPNWDIERNKSGKYRRYKTKIIHWGVLTYLWVKERKESWVRSNVYKVMAKEFPNMMKDVKPQIQKTLLISSKKI